jgi:6-phosphofructokinase
MKEIFSDEKLKKELSEEVCLFPLPAIKVDDDERFRIFTNEPRHLLRSVPPSFSDVIMGSRLGALAIDNAMAGYTDFMVSQWHNEYVLVPLDLVALGRKHIPQEGIFWKSVLAKTGQGVLNNMGKNLKLNKGKILGFRNNV